MKNVTNDVRYEQAILWFAIPFEHKIKLFAVTDVYDDLLFLLC